MYNEAFGWLEILTKPLAKTCNIVFLISIVFVGKKNEKKILEILDNISD